MQITTLTWANEVTWNVDGGTAFGPYEDNSVNDDLGKAVQGGSGADVGQPSAGMDGDGVGEGWSLPMWRIAVPTGSEAPTTAQSCGECPPVCVRE